MALAAIVGLSGQLINPLVQDVTRPGGAGDGALSGVAGTLCWTPPGLLAAAPGRVLPVAVGSLVLVAALVAVLLGLWTRSVRRALERPDASGTRRRRGTGLGPRGLPLPAGRVGAVAAKDLRHLLREPRRLLAAVTSGLLPVLVGWVRRSCPTAPRRGAWCSSCAGSACSGVSVPPTGWGWTAPRSGC